MLSLEGGKIFSQQYLAQNCRNMCSKNFENRLINKDFMTKNNFE